jgi:hypothetical protein
VDNFAVDIGESEVATLKTVCELAMIDAKQVKYRCL